jgi:hypothetical protein
MRTRLGGGDVLPPLTEITLDKNFLRYGFSVPGNRKPQNDGHNASDDLHFGKSRKQSPEGISQVPRSRHPNQNQEKLLGHNDPFTWSLFGQRI